MSNSDFVLMLFGNIRQIFKKNKGKKHEELVFAAFERRPQEKKILWPEANWIQFLTRGEESQGIDVIVHCNLGIEVKVQIKSSHEAALRFKEKQKLGRYKEDIVVVVIDDTHENLMPQDIRQILVSAITQSYEDQLGAFPKEKVV